MSDNENKSLMSSDEVKSILSIVSSLLPLFISLVNKLTDIIKGSENLSDSDKEALLVIINDMQIKVSELTPIE